MKMRTPAKRGVLLEGIETQYIRIKAQDAYYGMSKGNA